MATQKLILTGCACRHAAHSEQGSTGVLGARPRQIPATQDDKLTEITSVSLSALGCMRKGMRLSRQSLTVYRLKNLFNYTQNVAGNGGHKIP